MNRLYLIPVFALLIGLISSLSDHQSMVTRFNQSSIRCEASSQAPQVQKQFSSVGPGQRHLFQLGSVWIDLAAESWGGILNWPSPEVFVVKSENQKLVIPFNFAEISLNENSNLAIHCSQGDLKTAIAYPKILACTIEGRSISIIPKLLEVGQSTVIYNPDDFHQVHFKKFSDRMIGFSAFVSQKNKAGNSIQTDQYTSAWSQSVSQLEWTLDSEGRLIKINCQVPDNTLGIIESLLPSEER